MKLGYFLFLLFFISSCCTTETITCTNGVTRVNVVGNINRDSAFAVRYKQDNAFDIAIDTLAIRADGGSSDTVQLVFEPYDSLQSDSWRVEDSLKGDLAAGFDYKIFFPLDTLTYTITNLTATGSYQQRLKHCGDVSAPTCVRNAITCSVNGVSTAISGLAAQSSSYSPSGWINLVR